MTQSRNPRRRPGAGTAVIAITCLSAAVLLVLSVRVPVPPAAQSGLSVTLYPVPPGSSPSLDRGQATAAASATAVASPALPASPAAPASPQAPASPSPAQDAAAQGNCTLIAPADPLSAQGLATPYQLTGPQGMTPQASGCTMANAANNGAFVQAVIVSPAGQLSVYDPLVITQGTTPAAQPVVPQIPPGSVVGIWTGFNGNALTIAGPGGALFSQGLPGSPFGQVAAVNAAAFFAAARQLAQVPALGTARDGLPCPTTRDFSLVDQDPSDNVTTQYILTGTGQTAQDNAANEAALGTSLVSNGSDNNLLARFVDPALGCAPFEAPDLTAPGRMTSAQGLNELQAAADQAAPAALVPPNDPMTTAGVDADINPGQLPGPGNLSPAKTNLYRANVGQPALAGRPVQAATRFCRDLRDIAPGRLARDAGFEGGPSPIAGMTLAQFLAQRLANSLTLLNCRRFGRS